MMMMQTQPQADVKAPYQSNVVPSAQTPHKGFRLSRPLVLFAAGLLLLAGALGLAALLGTKWITYENIYGTSPRFSFLGLRSATANAQARISLWKIEYEDFPTRKFTQNLIDFIQSYPESVHCSSKYLNAPIRTIRACRMLVLVGIVLSFFGAAILLVTAAMKTTKKYRTLRLFGVILTFFAFGAYLSCFIIWMTIPTYTYYNTECDRFAVDLSFKLKCNGCDWGYCLWIDLACFIICFVALLAAAVAMEPPILPPASEMHYELPPYANVGGTATRAGTVTQFGNVQSSPSALTYHYDPFYNEPTLKGPDYFGYSG